MYNLVHLITVESDKDLILKSIKESGYPIQKAYLVIGENNDNEVVNEIEEKLKALVDVNRIYVSKSSVYDAAQRMLEVIKQEQVKGNKVVVNTTNSSETLCLACHITAQLSDSKLYLKLDDTAKGIIELPIPVVKEINKDRLKIIKTLQDNGGSIESLKEFIELIEGKASGKKYMAQRARLNHYLKSLEEDNLIKMERTGKKSRS